MHTSVPRECGALLASTHTEDEPEDPHMTIRSRLALGLLAIAIILVVPLLLTLRSFQGLHRSARALRDNEFAASLLVGRLREGLNELRRQETALLFIHKTASRDAMQSGLAHVTRLTDSLERYQLNESARDIRRAVHQLAILAPFEYQAALDSQPAKAESISVKRLVPELNAADSGVLIAERDLRERTAARVDQSAVAISQAEVLSVVALLLALGVSAAVALWLTRSISRPILELEHGMRAVADGDLAYRLPLSSDRPDEFGKLARSFDEMTRQLGELDKLKAEFVSVASHELKTPINVIVGYVGLLEEGVYGPLSEQQHQILGTLDSQARSLARLVNQLLDVSRFEAGGGKLEPRRLDLTHFLDELERTFHVLAVQRGIRFVVTRGEGLPAHVTWDPDRINEVLGNLLSNAFKFTQRGGTVDLTVEPIDAGLQMAVQDSGAGIPADQVPRVFEKFYQASNQSAASARGSGLGLAIAKEIVEAHLGTILCESTPGVGTTFTITLPVQVGRRRSSLQLAAVGAA
jgi:signal transduction histidine kinase